MIRGATVMLATAVIAGTGATWSSNHLVSANVATSSYIDAGPFSDSTTAPVVIDSFEKIDQWKPTPSDGVRLSLAQDAGQHGKSMRLDFDFQGHGGYAVIHRNVDLNLPSNYEFSFDIRGDSPVNTLEFKLIDATGDNVWWSNQRNFVFPRKWRTVTRKKRQITFAWGPIGGGDIKHVAAIEMSVTAGSGGKGSVWIDDLMLTELEAAGPYNLTPRVTASSSEPAHAPVYALDNKPATTWRSRPSSPSDSSSLSDRLSQAPRVRRNSSSTGKQAIGHPGTRLVGPGTAEHGSRSTASHAVGLRAIICTFRKATRDMSVSLRLLNRGPQPTI